MDLMVNPTITKFAQKVDGEITELKLGAKQEDAYAQIYQKGAESGGGKVENNKTATINVSTYTEPVEITPTSGKTSMKKATVTLSNIPSGVTTLYAWYYEGDACYTTTPTPTTSDKVLHTATEYSPILAWFDIGSVTEEGITIESGEDVFVRDAERDISLT